MNKIILGCLIANLIMYIINSGITVLSGHLLYKRNKSKIDGFISKGTEGYKTFTETMNKILKLLDKFKIK